MRASAGVGHASSRVGLAQLAGRAFCALLEPKVDRTAFARGADVDEQGDRGCTALYSSVNQELHDRGVEPVRQHLHDLLRLNCS